MDSRKAVYVAVISAALAVGSAVALIGCSAPRPEATSGPRDSNSPRVAFYGDSYTLGTGASAPEKRWSTIICGERGWSEFNSSVNGLGFINNRSVFGDGDQPSRVIDDKPDIVFVTMGLNDNFSFDAKAD
jgi:lysophospholipase L1-like esterase